MNNAAIISVKTLTSIGDNSARFLINVPLRYQDEELYDLFSLCMNEWVQQGKLYIQQIGDNKPFYDFTSSLGVDRNQWDQERADTEGS